MTEDQFRVVSELIHGRWGIRMTFAKKTMLESRLLKRLRGLSMDSFSEYVDYLFSPTGMDRELRHLIDVVSTNKTNFFREPPAFAYLESSVLPEWFQHRKRPPRCLIAWSAGCATGEEPYTLAMVLAEYFRSKGIGAPDFAILATDVSTRALDTARSAIYSEQGAEEIPVKYRPYLMRSKDRSPPRVRIVPELRKKVRFRNLNLMDDFHLVEKPNIIFCRNVIIYFDRATQEILLKRLCRELKAGGHLFMGHSESLNNMDLPVVAVAPSIYRKLPTPTQ